MTRLKDFKVTITYPYQSRPTKQVIVQGINPRDAEQIAENIFGGRAKVTSQVRGTKIKTFKEFNEAVSAVRLAQLAAKGKGTAAAAQMAADGLKAAGTAAKATKALPPAGGTGGSAIFKASRPSPKLPGTKAGALVRSSAGALVRSSAGQSALAKTGKVTPASGVADEKQSPGPGPRDGRPTFGDKVKEKAYQAKKGTKNLAGDLADKGLRKLRRYANSAKKKRGGTMDFVSGDKGGAPQTRGGYE